MPTSVQRRRFFDQQHVIQYVMHNGIALMIYLNQNLNVGFTQSQWPVKPEIDALSQTVVYDSMVNSLIKDLNK